MSHQNWESNWRNHPSIQYVDYYKTLAINSPYLFVKNDSISCVSGDESIATIKDIGTEWKVTGISDGTTIIIIAHSDEITRYHITISSSVHDNYAVPGYYG